MKNIKNQRNENECGLTSSGSRKDIELWKKNLKLGPLLPNIFFFLRNVENNSKTKLSNNKTSSKMKFAIKYGLLFLTYY